MSRLLFGPGDKPLTAEVFKLLAAKSAMATHAQELSVEPYAGANLERRFRAVTAARLSRVFENLTERQQDLLDLVPLLFHINHPLLPGYVSQDTAAGVCDYQPTKSTMRAAKRVSKAFKYERRLLPHFAVLGIYLMGSPGTIAYSRASDLDLWLCHNPDLAPKALAKLTKKARLIESYAKKIGVEMHFFILNAERFRSGKTLTLSTESSGSSQHHLLLDEFYRSSLILAGLPPMWWYVPPDHDQRYDEFIAESTAKRRIIPSNYLDFGGLTGVPTAEFFGAAVWQIYKSIDSPYKSLLKLLLMEAYVAEYPNTVLLSHRFKRAISQPDFDLNDVDPYISMYMRIEEYLSENQDIERLNLVRRAFYLKANERLSARQSKNSNNWRRQLLQSVVNRWGWSEGDIKRLDNRNNWKINTAAEERREIIRCLQKSYSIISDFARTYAKDKKITESDLNALARKLYAAFEKKPHKVEQITRGICKDPSEKILSLHLVRGEDDRETWIIYAGIVTPDQLTNHTPLRQAKSVVDLIAWCHFNHIAGIRTDWRLFTHGHRLAQMEVMKVLGALESKHPKGKIKAAEPRHLTRSARIRTAQMFINVGVDPLGRSLDDNEVLTSNFTDAFQFGGRQHNLIKTVDLVIGNSWEEVFCHQFTGKYALLDAMTEYWRAARTPTIAAKSSFDIYCYSNDYANVIVQRIGEFAKDLTAYFAANTDIPTSKYVLGVGGKYAAIGMHESKPRSQHYDDLPSLIKALGNVETTGQRVHFDSHCLTQTPLPVIYAANKGGTVQVFAEQRNDQARIYVLDQRGALFTQQQTVDDLRMVFDHLNRFITSVLRDPKTRISGNEETPPEAIEFYQILSKDNKAKVNLVAVNFEQARDYFPIRVFADVDETDQSSFTVFCGEVEFSSQHHGSALFTAVAEHVTALRTSQVKYPIYITDFELSPRFIEQRGAANERLPDLLNYKHKFEQHLTAAMGYSSRT